MNTPYLKLAGGLAFMATAILGWQFAGSTGSASRREPSATADTKRSTRPTRSPRLVAMDAAGQRMSALLATPDPEARMLATIALANSLALEDFAAWKDGGWFTLRGGPELLVFSQILMERWLKEDPDGLLAWAVKSQNDTVMHGLMEEWAVKEPQRLVDFFKDHRDDQTEFQMLARIAASTPEIALQGLREMIAAGGSDNSVSSSGPLFDALARKSPAALEAMLGTLPGSMKVLAEGALSRVRLEVAFPEEMQRLWDRPDGWKIFSASALSSDEISGKLIGELANLPPEWRRGIAENPWRLTQGANAEKWWNADLKAAGFSDADVKAFRYQILQSMARSSPGLVIQRLGEVDLGSEMRKYVLEGIFAGGKDPEKLRPLIAQLPTEEDRETATRLIGRQPVGAPDTEVKAPEDLLVTLGQNDSKSTNSVSCFQQMMTWGPEKISALVSGFKGLPDERKQNIAQTVVARLGTDDVPTGLAQESIRYLMEHPSAMTVEDGSSARNSSAVISQYATRFSDKDPEAASAWVDQLPAGDAKSWVQKNLYDNWTQYDPQAAARWKKALPDADRAALDKLPSYR